MKSVLSMFKQVSLEERFLWVYTALIPFLNLSFFSLMVRKVISADIVFVGFLIVFVVRYSSGKVGIKKTSLGTPLILMLLSFLPSFFNSVSYFDSIFELTGLIYLVVLFLLLINVISTPQKLQCLLYVYLFVSGVISLIGLLCFCYVIVTGNIQGNPFFYYTTIESTAHHFPRLQLTLGTPNMLLTYLHTALICGVILFLLDSRKNFRKIIVVCLAIIVLAALLTGSRRFTGFLLSSFIILSILDKGGISFWLKRICLIGFIVFLVVSFITSIWVIFPVNITKDGGAKTLSLQAHYSYSLHFLQPVTSLNMFKKHPFIGVGYGTYNRHFKEYVDWQWVRSSFGFEAYPESIEAVRDKTLNFDPHSVFLGTLAEAGVVGLLGLIFFLSKYVKMLFKRFKNSKDGRNEKIISGCILAGFIGFLFNGLFTDILSMRHFWFLMAIGLACNNLPKSEGMVNAQRA